jgi:hypothetical protein
MGGKGRQFAPVVPEADPQSFPKMTPIRHTSKEFRF